MASSCPVDHEKLKANATSATAAFTGSSCPVKDEVIIDPTNNMPKIAQQEKWPGQARDLPTERKVSSIPKDDFTPPHQSQPGETKNTDKWVYPSEQQFYNAMKRKGWQDVREEDMRTVVGIHNAVNERTWGEVKKWEARLHCEECKEDQLKLARFLGRPKDLSPKARMKIFLGYTPPFDRHDWIVNRCGKEVRYVVDFYKGPTPSSKNSLMEIVSFHIDARPALDSWEAFADRVKMNFLEVKDKLFS